MQPFETYHRFTLALVPDRDNVSSNFDGNITWAKTC